MATSDTGPQPLSANAEIFRRLVESVRDYAIFMLTPEGVIASWNNGAQLIKQYTAAEAIGKHFSIFYLPDAVASGWPEEELRRSLRDGRFEDEGWRVRKDGSRFWANVIISPLLDASGTLLGYSKVTRDLTERRRHEEQLREREERLRLIVDGVKDHAMFLLDPSGRIESWNPAAQKVLGYAPSEIVGRDAAILYPAQERTSGRPQAEMAAAAHAGAFHSHAWKVKADGAEVWTDGAISAIRDSDGRLKGFVHILRDLTEQRRIAELEAEGRRILEFIAMLSHELRNPLAPIRNAVSILKLPQGQQQATKYADMIGRQVAHLTRLVDDLMDVSRITTGKIQLEHAPLELNTLVQVAVDSMRATFEQYGHEVEVRPAPQPVFIEGDAVRLTQVVVNLLSNAAKYTAPKGRIEVEVSRNHSVVRLDVIDNGIGMSEALLERVFDPFVQGERALDRAEGGLGIGLTLVKKLVELHGGSVLASSAGPGRGAKFTITLPLAGDRAQPLSAVAPPVRAEPANVLVVDDNRDVAESLVELLEANGCEVHVAFSGREAIDVAASTPLTAVLLDVGLPDMSGYDVARRLRSLPSMQGVRIIATTGYGLKRDRDASAAAGIDAHLVKPIDHEEVLRLIA
jgi:PAS domain S-box-containing protein|nr:PAS domain S-box protein [Caldimonas sp.]